MTSCKSLCQLLNMVIIEACSPNMFWAHTNNRVPNTMWSGLQSTLAGIILLITSWKYRILMLCTTQGLISSAVL